MLPGHHGADAGTRLTMQVVDKSRYAAGDNSLEREIQVLLKVCVSPRAGFHSSPARRRCFQGQLRRRHSISLCCWLVQVDHENCIRLYDVFITPRKVYIVTELVTGGELLDRWGAI